MVFFRYMLYAYKGNNEDSSEKKLKFGKSKLKFGYTKSRHGTTYEP